MIDYIRDIDYSKYHTFVLAYYQGDSQSDYPIVRPCTATYEEMIDTTKTRCVTLDAAVAAFKPQTSLPEILLEASLNGIPIDFIDIYAKTESSVSHWSDYKIIQVIDTHKEDVTKLFGIIDAKRYYIAPKKPDKHFSQLKFLVVDRLSQSQDIKFLNGEYDDKAVLAAFKRQKEAKAFCEKLNQQMA